ncbi:tRNA-dihydrouridine(16) synthase [Trichinella spiralis]|uniref:tRNA-dihydrouridine(16) synthase n=1 Tax=Trichinella spiralis TaxID=6334 RepID=A0ABR3KGT6_TRISP
MFHLAGLKQTTVIQQSNAIRNIPAVDAGSHTAKSVTCGCPIKHIHGVVKCTVQSFIILAIFAHKCFHGDRRKKHKIC